jgi:regulator of cell morphogenesis and NO signaling
MAIRGRTVEEIVREHPDALEVFKAHGINHCCGGRLTLAEAAAAAGMPVETLLDALRACERPAV